MVAASRLRGLCFTGSWTVGRRILEAARRSARAAGRARDGRQERVRRPRRLRAAPGGARGRGRRLSLGRPALHRHRARARPPQDRRSIHRRAREGRARAAGSATPRIPTVFAGPLATAGALTKVEHAIEVARKAGAEPIVAGREAAGRLVPHAPRCTGCPTACTTSPATPTSRCSAPISCVEVIDRDDEAIAVLEASPYGFVNAVFTGSRGAVRGVPRAHAGPACSTAIARPTSRAPKLPFGGVGKSGNYRPAGAWAHRNVTAPLGDPRERARRGDAAPAARAD